MIHNQKGPLSPLRQRGLTLLIAAVGAALFSLADLPLPFLFGPMAGCLIAALAGVQLRSLGQVSALARTVLGVAVGASITPALFAQLPAMALSVALVPLMIMVSGLIGVPYFRRVWGFDTPTAYYAAMPGGLQDMVLFGIEAGGDPRALSLIHATRVLIVVTIVPLLLTQFFGATLSNPIGAPATDVPIHELLLMAAAAIFGWKAAEKVGLFGASILGPMLIAAALSLTDFIHMRPPREAILAAQFFLGMALGVHFVGVTLAEMRRAVLAGATFVLLLSGFAALLSLLVAGSGLGGTVEAFLAFAPGGQAEMTILAIITGADLGFVVTHHLVRIILVILGAPIAAALTKTFRL